jgi:hypothetical protein
MAIRGVKTVRGPFWPWRDPLVEAVVDAARIPGIGGRILAVRDAAHELALRGANKPRLGTWSAASAAYLRDLEEVLDRSN